MDTNQLRQFPLFAALSDAEAAALLGELEERRLPAGAVLMAEGERSETIFLLVEGEAAVCKAAGSADERLLNVVGPGTMLGEMSIFLENHAHTATVYARTPLVAWAMTHAQFDRLLRTRAEVTYGLLRAATLRQSESDEQVIADLRAKNEQLTQAYNDLQAAQDRLIEQQKTEHELSIAGKIQRSILPQRLPLDPRMDFGALMVPARAVGGDFYDFIPLPGGSVGVVLGDVVDKGMPAALYMALAYSALRLEAVKGETPGDTLRAVNCHLKEISQAGMYVTLVYGVVDPQEGTFTYARAGHPYPLLLDRAYKAREVEGGTGHPLGMFWEIALDEQAVQIPPGGTLLIYSDGLSETIEARAGSPELGPFCEQLLAGAEPCSAQELCERLWQAAGDGSGGSPPVADDFTVVAVQRRMDGGAP